MTNQKRARRHEKVVATNADQAKVAFLQTLTAICDPAHQPHMWVGKPDVLGEILIKLIAAYMGADIRVDVDRRQ